MNRVFNFSAGPGTLPESVLLEVKEELPAFRDAGASVMEISHRSPQYTDVAASAASLLRELLGISDKWHVLFLQGGASMQFHQAALNFIPSSGSADYLVTGAWAKKALHEANVVASGRSVASSEDTNFNRIPTADEWDLSEEAAFLHYTSNNTIFGTEMHWTPEAPVPLICDASSDFLSRPIEMEPHGLLYAGAQKNIGPAGTTVVLVRDSFLQKRQPNLPTMLDYGTHAAKLFNTPPVFAVYIVEKVLRWLKSLGGVSAIETINKRKAALLYDLMDASEFYRGTAEPTSRSLMNVTFRLPSEELEQAFVSEAADQGLVALKGHRSVGGIRASIYNACPEEGVQALADFMRHFESTRG